MLGRRFKIYISMDFVQSLRTELPDAMRASEKERYSDFLVKLEQLDDHARLARLVWEEFSGTFRVLLNNRYVFALFWEFQKLTRDEWESGFRSANGCRQCGLGKRRNNSCFIDRAEPPVYIAQPIGPWRCNMERVSKS